VNPDLQNDIRLTYGFSFDTVENARNARKVEVRFRNYQLALQPPRAKPLWKYPARQLYDPSQDSRSSQDNQSYRQSVGKKSQSSNGPQERKNTGGHIQRRSREVSNPDDYHNFRAPNGDNHQRNPKYSNKGKHRTSVSSQKFDSQKHSRHSSGDNRTAKAGNAETTRVLQLSDSNRTSGESTSQTAKLQTVNEYTFGSEADTSSPPKENGRKKTKRGWNSPFHNAEVSMKEDSNVEATSDESFEIIESQPSRVNSASSLPMTAAEKTVLSPSASEKRKARTTSSSPVKSAKSVRSNPKDEGEPLQNAQDSPVAQQTQLATTKGPQTPSHQSPIPRKPHDGVIAPHPTPENAKGNQAKAEKSETSPASSHTVRAVSPDPSHLVVDFDYNRPKESNTPESKSPSDSGTSTKTVLQITNAAPLKAPELVDSTAIKVDVRNSRSGSLETVASQKSSTKTSKPQTQDSGWVNPFKVQRVEEKKQKQEAKKQKKINRKKTLKSKANNADVVMSGRTTRQQSPEPLTEAGAQGTLDAVNVALKSHIQQKKTSLAETLSPADPESAQVKKPKDEDGISMSHKRF
jgi:hypothetical protein